MNDNSVIGTNCERESERKREKKDGFDTCLEKKRWNVWQACGARNVLCKKIDIQNV